MQRDHNFVNMPGGNHGYPSTVRRIDDDFYFLFHFLIFYHEQTDTALKARRKTINSFQKGNTILRELNSLWP